MKIHNLDYAKPRSGARPATGWLVFAVIIAFIGLAFLALGVLTMIGSLRGRSDDEVLPVGCFFLALGLGAIGFAIVLWDNVRARRRHEKVY